MSEWRPIPGYVETYLVSDSGDIRSLPRNTTRGGLLKQKISTRGYPAVALVQNGKQATHEVHRLVALAFLGPRPRGMEVRHLNGDPLDGRLVNLAYGTRSENQLDKRAYGTDRNVSKTHCPKGHAYTGDNVRVLSTRPGARYCRTCESERAVLNAKRSQARTLPLSVRRRQPWTPQETAFAMRSDLTAEEIALRLKRSVQAVRRQRTRARAGAVPIAPDFDPGWLT